MQGYIVKHSHQGIGKIVEAKSNTVKIRFLDGREHQFGPSAFRDGSITHAKLNIGHSCMGPNGPCTVSRISKTPPNDAPIIYEVNYADGLSAEVSELELIPLAAEVKQDPLLQFASLSPHSYKQFIGRERLVSAYSRMLREGAGLRALLSSRVDLRPHQAYVAGVVLLDVSRRYVLADEVGLGKTIEAGIAIHDLLTQKPDARVLVLCPGALTQQWLSEIYAKFGGQIFNLLDLHAGRSVRWQGLRKVIASTTLAAYDAAEQLSAIRWDMIVVDEAHHLLASPVLYDFVQRLSRSVPSLLLLSAIPAQRREDDFLRLLSLLEPDRYHPDSPAEGERFRTLYAAQSDIGRRLRRLSRRIAAAVSGDATHEDVASLVGTLLDLPGVGDDERLKEMISSLRLQAQNFIADAMAILHHVADTHRINRRIIRNRRQRLIEEGQLQHIERKFAPLPYQPEQLEIETTQAVESLIKEMHSRAVPGELLVPFVRVLMQSLVLPSTAHEMIERVSDSKEARLNSKGMDFLSMGYMFGYEDWNDFAQLLCMGMRPHVSEELLEQALERAEAWQRSRRGMARLNKLLTFLKAKQRESLLPKLLVFAGFPGAAQELAEQLRASFGPQAVKEFRYDLPQEEKEQNVRQFQSSPQTWLLVSDETGGEGRNFQFASEIVHFDTPWYAARVEQRVGRLDRLGRDRFRCDVISNVIYSDGSAEHGLVRCYNDGLKVYEQSISGLEFALRDVEQRIVEVTLNGGYDALIDHVDELGGLASQERAQDDSEAVLDEASFELKSAERFRRVNSSPDGERRIEEAFVDYFRMISTPRSAKEWHDSIFPVGIWKFSADNTLQPLPIPDKTQEGMFGEFKGTFRRDIAQQRPELAFFNVGNPLFDAVINSLRLHPTARTYAVACDAPGSYGWSGFEFVFYALPDLQILGGAQGIVNHAMGLFSAAPLHLFFTVDGGYSERGDELLALRQSLKGESKDRTWWNLTKDKAQVLTHALGGRDWQDTVLCLHESARKKARELYALRFKSEIEAEVGHIAEQVRQLRKRDDAAARADITALQLLAMSISEWKIELDSLGFLSVNEINVG
jgi:ATP-dependent helicase HepA